MNMRVHMLHCAAGCLACLLAAAPGNAEPVSADQAAIFVAAGFTAAADGHYRRCEEEIPMASSMPGQIRFEDLNGDGVAEAWVTESSLFCYGNTGQYFVLLAEDQGTWQRVLESAGIPGVLESGNQGWPDIEVGGPGFAKSPVYRWNGQVYAQRN